MVVLTARAQATGQYGCLVQHIQDSYWLYFTQGLHVQCFARPRCFFFIVFSTKLNFVAKLVKAPVMMI